MAVTGGHGFEAALGRGGFPEDVFAPAGDGVVVTQPTTVPPASGNGFEAALGCVNHSEAVVTPAGDGVVVE